MYGFSGYATNPYASERQNAVAYVIQLGARTFSLLYGLLIQPIRVNQNDYGYELGPWTLNDGSGNPQNLSSANLILNVQDSQDPTGALMFSGPVSVDNVSTGIVHYTVGEGNFARPGTFLAQIVANFSGESVSWPAFQIIVLPALPKAIN